MASIGPIYFHEKLGRQDRPFLIFVEGADDAHFLDVLLREQGANPDAVGIIIVGGKDRFGPALSLYRKGPFFKKSRGILIIRDADENPEIAIRETIATTATSFNVNVAHGELTPINQRRIGLFVLPSGTERGDLEKLCLETVAGTEIDQHANTYLDSVKSDVPFSHFFKRKAQIVLAGMPGDLCRGAGMGFKRECFNEDHEALAPLKKMLREFIAGSEGALMNA